MAGMVGCVAWIWPDVAVQACVNTFDDIQRKLKTTRPGRPLAKVTDYLSQNAPVDCGKAGWSLWEEGVFSARVDLYLTDGVITDAESRDLIALYDASRRR